MNVSHKFSLFAVFVPKFFTVGGNLNKLLAKTTLHAFFGDTVYFELISWLTAVVGGLENNH